MMRYSILAAIGIGLVAVPATAQAIDPDVKCMLVSNLFSQAEKDPARKQLAAASGIFYFGRVDAHLSLPQLRAQMIALDKAVKAADLPGVMTDCARKLQAKQKAFDDMRRALAAAAAARAPVAPAPK